MPPEALLVLQDGTVFRGVSVGADGEAVGEVVFNTSMTGYQEILTDPSYRGQIVVMTHVEIGNYGIHGEDSESAQGPQVEGFVVREFNPEPSNWRAQGSLQEMLQTYGIPAIAEIDTRALTQHLRTHGTQMGILSTMESDPQRLWEKIRGHPGIGGLDLVSKVTSKEPVTLPPTRALSPTFRLVVYDYGVKQSILRHLRHVGFELHVVPADTPAEAVLESTPDAVFLSNGPGDPSAVPYAIRNVQKLIGKLPIFGICLGHQILGLALGGRTYKLKFGHHGGNHPVQDLRSGRIYITAQNHNYCVDIRSLKGQVTLTHRNLYDGTEEGMMHVDLPLYSVQFHPEAGPGPHDARVVFQEFRNLLIQWKG